MHTFMEQDTICAIATPVGEGGIGLVKVSGPGALALAERLFRPSRPGAHLASHRLVHGHIVDPGSQEVIDEVLLAFMAAPATYTREDILEINCHSGYAVLERILALVLDSGPRLALPGEFTRRAFLNGRIDLSQAEAVIELIHSRSEQSLLQANRHLGGELRHRVEAWREGILRLQTRIEAAIDFADDLEDDAHDLHISAEDLDRDLIAPMSEAVSGYAEARVLREGLTLVLAGKPNAGKSSLLNALLRRDRAIVTPVPGTTRDVIEDSFTLSGVTVRVLDTAGIREEPDEIESLGIDRALRSVSEADAVLWVLDSSRPADSGDEAVHRALSDTRHIKVLNKSDLPRVLPEEAVRDRFGEASPLISISALAREDVDRLRTLLSDTFLKKPIERGSSSLVPNLRQKTHIENALRALRRAAEETVPGGQLELTGIELDCARRELDALLGIDGDPDLLDRIFSEFCIGK